MITLVPKNAEGKMEKNLVPEVNPNFVPFGNFETIKVIIASRRWYPIYISGHSGCGKNESIRQACAELNRELVRIQITAETERSDLVGSMRVTDGTTHFHYGPIVEAMRRGAIVILDEYDMGSPERLACLQAVLEGRPLYIEKTNEYIYPAEGFNVFATGNTKGQSDITGRYAGTRTQNESTLERFGLNLEQEYPEPEVEKKILELKFASLGLDLDENETFINNLTIFAESTRKQFKERTINDVISTRRLLFIATAYSIFKDKFKAVNLSLGRFDETTRLSFYGLFEALQAKDDKKRPVIKSLEKNTFVLTPESFVTFVPIV